MTPRTYGPMDVVLGQIDKAIKVLATRSQAARPYPAAADGELVMEDAQIRAAASLMRVNHAGEVAAQALYQGQALTARNAAVAASMQQAAAEEIDHLAWCEQRLEELNTGPSLLNPLWYAGSFAIGALAGALGDRMSLGFIVETERQVESHLNGHLDRLPAEDRRSRAIVEQMKADEAGHGAKARSLGGEELPFAVRSAMRLTSRLMTLGSALM